MKAQRDRVACPCGSGKDLAECCGAYLHGSIHAPTAEALMRSRYTAYVLGNARYLLDTWHASTRPSSLQLEPEVKWIRLKVIASSADRVEFVATCRVNGKAQKLHENSRFVREEGRWYYLDGDV